MSLTNLDLLSEAFKPAKAKAKKPDPKKSDKPETEPAPPPKRTREELDAAHGEAKEEHAKLKKERDRHKKTVFDAHVAYAETPEGKQGKRPHDRSHPNTVAAWDAFADAEGCCDDHEAAIRRTAARARKEDYERQTGRVWTHHDDPHGLDDEHDADLDRVHAQLTRAEHPDRHHVRKVIDKTKEQKKESLDESIDLFRRL